MIDISALSVALRHAPGENRLLSETISTVTLGVGQMRHALPRLPEDALRAEMPRPRQEASLSGWAVDAGDLAPVLLILLKAGHDGLMPVARAFRPDIRAMHGFDYDGTGFEFDRPKSEHATLLFILRGGVVIKHMQLVPPKGPTKALFFFRHQAAVFKHIVRRRPTAIRRLLP
ncbi:hypothetical protein OCH239_10215 [Roseivivax halodurans JCM 10272]|uniref:Uncharacterized protein n=1 Tax=Roseivivax halodurans JCM 10272 TaxID=1449350 RepID=X7EE59_9RHOB|nr:hypothetical protein [Roseivivax halodurans]ETX13481.1 hypothetical protein OCH239_10215 [Roseivivax halodurans JCM 10272]